MIKTKDEGRRTNGADALFVLRRSPFVIAMYEVFEL